MTDIDLETDDDIEIDAQRANPHLKHQMPGLFARSAEVELVAPVAARRAYSVTHRLAEVVGRGWAQGRAWQPWQC